MVKLRKTLVLLGAFAVLSSPVFGQGSGPLQNFEIQSFDLFVREMVYDSKRNLIYATVGDNGPDANSLVTICPRSAQVIDSVFVGLDPDQIAISADCERIFLGVNGQRSFRVWEPSSGSLSQHFPILVDGDDPAIAEEMRAYPGDSEIVVIAADKVNSSADGILLFYDDNGNQIRQAGFGNELIFTDKNTLVANWHGAFPNIRKFHFDGHDLTSVDSISSNSVGGGFELIGSGIVSTNGVVMDSESLLLSGTYSTSGNPEWIEMDDTVYFFSSVTLRLFDRRTFLEIDSVSTGLSGASVRNLLHVGENRLAVSSGLTTAIITNVPATSINVDAQLGDIDGDCQINLQDIDPFVELLVAKTYRFEADMNQDLSLDILDVQPFVDAISQ